MPFVLLIPRGCNGWVLVCSQAMGLAVVWRCRPVQSSLGGLDMGCLGMIFRILQGGWSK